MKRHEPLSTAKVCGLWQCYTTAKCVSKVFSKYSLGRRIGHSYKLDIYGVGFINNFSVDFFPDTVYYF